MAAAAASLLAAFLMTAAPASAAPALTPASCDALSGTFLRVKGVKTCTFVSSTIRRENPTGFFHNLVVGPFPVDGLIHGVGYYGEWKQHEGYIDTLVSRQKGSGSVTTTATDGRLVYLDVYDEFCGESPDGFSVGFAYIVECEVAGVYPTEIPYPS
jgi:hypothetical protein